MITWLNWFCRSASQVYQTTATIVMVKTIAVQRSIRLGRLPELIWFASPIASPFSHRKRTVIVSGVIKYRTFESITARNGNRAVAISRLTSRLFHYPMQRPLFVTERTGLLAATQGRVLELCFETEQNVHYYSPWVTELVIVSLAGAPAESRRDTNDRGLRVERILPGADATSLPFEDRSFDWIVTTLTLCRTTNTKVLLAEMRRVLRPSGGYIFLEHGRSASPAMAQWQARLRNLWLSYGGCDLDRDLDRMIGEAGFRIEKLERFQFGRPRFLSTMYRGRARRG